MVVCFYYATLAATSSIYFWHFLSPYNYTPPIFLPHFYIFFFISTLLFSLYLNFTILPSLYLPFILNLLLPILFTIKICYILFHSIHILPHKKVNTLSLSLSLSHSRVLILHCIFALGWWIFVLSSTLGCCDFVVL